MNTKKLQEPKEMLRKLLLNFNREEIPETMADRLEIMKMRYLEFEDDLASCQPDEEDEKLKEVILYRLFLKYTHDLALDYDVDSLTAFSTIIQAIGGNEFEFNSDNHFILMTYFLSFGEEEAERCKKRKEKIEMLCK